LGLQSPLYTEALEDLTSHGYVVVAVDHPYDTTVTVFPDGQIAKFAQDKFDTAAKKPHGYIDYADERIEVMATDIRFVVGELSRYDGQAKLGGLSLPGTWTSTEWAHSGIQLVEWPRRGPVRSMPAFAPALMKTALMIWVPRFRSSRRGRFPSSRFFCLSPAQQTFSEKALHPSDESLTQQKLTRVQYGEIIQKQQRKQNELLADIRGGAYRVMLFDLPGFTHRSFSDLPLLAAGHDPTKSDEAQHNFQVAQAFTRGFFDKYLKAEQQTVLDAKSPPDERVKVDRFGPAAKVEAPRSTPP
jgi:hypothetical protein